MVSPGIRLSFRRFIEGGWLGGFVASKIFECFISTFEYFHIVFAHFYTIFERFYIVFVNFCKFSNIFYYMLL
jgi:hypothetical protein